MRRVRGSLARMATRLAGCRQLRRTRQGAVVGVYHAGEAHLDDAGGSWVTVCEDHGVVVNHATLALARWHASDPIGWCEECCERSE